MRQCTTVYPVYCNCLRCRDWTTILLLFGTEFFLSLSTMSTTYCASKHFQFRPLSRIFLWVGKGFREYIFFLTEYSLTPHLHSHTHTRKNPPPPRIPQAQGGEYTILYITSGGLSRPQGRGNTPRVGEAPPLPLMGERGKSRGKITVESLEYRDIRKDIQYNSIRDDDKYIF